MNDFAPYAFGSEKIYIGAGAMTALTAFKYLPGKRVLVFSGVRSWEAAWACGLQSTLDSADVQWKRVVYDGYCSFENRQKMLQEADAFQAQILLGAGGGKCMDAVKAVADEAGLSCILVPTSAATCAASVRSCVCYDQRGRTQSGIMAKHFPNGLILDSDLLIGHCPPRLFAAGMMDALAKYPEIDFTFSTTATQQQLISMHTARAIAKSNFFYILEHGASAFEGMQANSTNAFTQNIMELNIIETGLCSSLMTGWNQLAIAHQFHDAIVTHFYEQRTALLHGEMVAVGVLMQMYVNGYDSKLIEETQAFIKSVGGPVCLSDMDIPPTEETKEIILHFMDAKKYRPYWELMLKAYDYINR